MIIATTPAGMQPIAYDAEGRPLYAAPPPEPNPEQQSAQAQGSSHVKNAPDAIDGHNFNPQMRAQYGNEPGVIHATREVELKHMEISEEMQGRHLKSKKRYPHLNLTSW